MAANSSARERELVAPVPWFRRVLPLTLVYFAVVAATHYAYFGDTMGYVQNILAYDHNHDAGRKYLWDFGHVLLRPLGWLLYRSFGNLLPYNETGENALTVAALMIAASVLGGLGAVLAIRALAALFLVRGWGADLVAIAFLCFHAILNWIQTGTSYMIGLMFISLSLLAIVRASENRDKARWYGIWSGLAASLAIVFWLPYIIAVPGILTTALLWKSRDSARAAFRERIPLVLVTCVSAGLLLSLVYVVPLVQLDIHSIAALKNWVGDASHGVVQNKRLLRMASGLPRSFIWIGEEGTLIKRYLLHDPYAHVTLSDIFAPFWRIMLFYIAVGCLLWALVRMQEDGRRVLLFLAAGAVPVLLFAVLVFESGAAERYLPMYPFLCLAIAFCISRYGQSRAAVTGVIGFLSITTVLNLAALWRSNVLAQHRPTEERALSLEHKVGPQGLVVVVSLLDDLYQLVSFFPFDSAVRRTSLPMYDVVVVANARVRTWRQDFAAVALRTLNLGQPVWISKRLLALRPEPSWAWTEGDDPNIAWKDLRPFFSRLNYGADVGGADGFLQLTGSEQNKNFLNEAVRQERQ